MPYIYLFCLHTYSSVSLNEGGGIPNFLKKDCFWANSLINTIKMFSCKIRK